jgi:hypothetical protein
MLLSLPSLSPLALPSLAAPVGAAVVVTNVSVINGVALRQIRPLACCTTASQGPENGHHASTPARPIRAGAGSRRPADQFPCCRSGADEPALYSVQRQECWCVGKFNCRQPAGRFNLR